MLQNDERLLIKLIQQYYGLVPSLVAKILLYHGTITKKRALSYSTLKENDFEKGLNVLIRCDYVSTTQIKHQKIIEIYPEKIISILYYPHYLVSIKKRFGVESVSLLKILFLYGHLSINDLIQRTLYHIIQTNSLEVVDDQIRIFINSLHEKCTNLLSQNIIIYAEENSNCDKTINYDENLIFAVLKKSLDPNPHNNVSKLISQSPLLKFNIAALNYLYFIELFPYLLNPPFENEEANFVFKVLLEMTFEKTFEMKPTVLPFQQVHEQCRVKYPKMSISYLQTVLLIFAHFFAPNFIKVNKHGCVLNFNEFLLNLVKIIVKEFIKKNYGENSVRIFGALLEEVCIFEHNLLNLLKIDTKELHRNLYILDQNRMININFYSEANQSSTFSARNVKKSFSVNLRDVIDCILKRCYYSLYSILDRCWIEINNQKDLIARKNHIENYKKEIEEMSLNKEEKNYLIKSAHNFMSDSDHKRSESLLSYESKIDKVEYHLVNHIFVLNLWKYISIEKDDLNNE